MNYSLSRSIKIFLQFAIRRKLLVCSHAIILVVREFRVRKPRIVEPTIPDNNIVCVKTPTCQYPSSVQHTLKATNETTCYNYHVLLSLR